MTSKGTRTLGLWLTLFTALTLLLAILAMPCVRQYKAVQWVRAQGGTVHHIDSWLSARLPDAAKVWLSDNGRLESLKRVRNVDLINRTQVTDAGLKHLKGVTSLRALQLANTQVTDAGLKHLKGLTDLYGLDLNRTQVTDAGLKHLKGMTSLRTLQLNQTQVTDAGLKHLKGMTSLRMLQLYSTQVTQAGVDDLKTALPLLEVEWSNLNDHR